MSIAEKLTTVADNVPEVYEAGKLALLKDSEYANATESGTVILINDVAPVEHSLGVKLSSDIITDFTGVEVARYGKNLFDFNSITKFYSRDGTQYNNYFKIENNVLKNIIGIYSRGVYCNSNISILPVGKYRLSCNVMVDKTEGEPPSFVIGYITTNGDRVVKFYRNTALQTWERFSFDFQLEKETEIFGFTFQGNGSIETYTNMNILFTDIQLELGETATEYEPYKEPQTATAKADGTVEGLTSISPSMTLLSNNPNAIITCQYYRDIDGVYEVGHEAGQQAERDSLWGRLQNNGQGMSYYYLFSYSRFSDETYNPQNDIVVSEGSTNGQNIFYSCSLTDTKVNMVANSMNMNGCFYRAGKLKNARKITVTEKVTFNNCFTSCESLEKIRFEGTIGNNISFSDSPLTVVSMNNIISCLKDLTGTDTTYTLTFRADRENMLTEEEKAVATNKGWTLVWN